MIERMYDLDIETNEGGSLRLTQQNGIDEPNVIHLHAIQIRLLAERAGLLKYEPNAGLVADLERRLGVLADKVQDFACNHRLREEILIADAGLEILARLDALCDLALELDGGRLNPEEPPDPEQPEAPPIDTANKPTQTAQAGQPELFQ